MENNSFGHVDPVLLFLLFLLLLCVIALWLGLPILYKRWMQHNYGTRNTYYRTTTVAMTKNSNEQVLKVIGDHLAEINNILALRAPFTDEGAELVKLVRDKTQDIKLTLKLLHLETK